MRLVALAALASAPFARCAVDVATTAPWPSGPGSLLAETAEALAEEGALWNFLTLRAGAEGSVAEADSSAVGLTRWGFDTARNLVPALTHDVLRVAVMARAYSPAVELHRQLALSSGGVAACGHTALAWAVVGTDKAVCHLSDLTHAIDAAHTAAALATPLTFDHVAPAATPALAVAAATKPLVTLYADVSHVPAFGPWHTALSKAASEGSVRYVFRHWFATNATERADSGTLLAGYGVGLDLKVSPSQSVVEGGAGSGAPVAFCTRVCGIAAHQPRPPPFPLVCLTTEHGVQVSGHR